MQGDRTSEPDFFFRENQRVSASEILQALASGCSIRLIQCVISGELLLGRLFSEGEDFHIQRLSIQEQDSKRILKIPQPLTFQACTFEENVFFAPGWDAAGSLKIVFESEVLFNSSVFCGQTRFSDAQFHALAGFDGCTFQRVVSFAQAEFLNRAMFRTVSFEGYALFNQAHFRNDTRFTNTSFSKGVNFTEVEFQGQTDFSGCYSRSKSVPVYEGVTFTRKRSGDEESFWRFIKQTCQEAGYYQQAGECFYREQCAGFWQRFRGIGYDRLNFGRKILRWTKGLRLLPELVFGRLLFGYGERPGRVLIAAVLIILCCAFFYSSDASNVMYRDSTSLNFTFMDGLYFSTVTFTTLGLGDIYPERTDKMTRLVAMAEALSGACLMALFVVCLSKRFSRG